MQALATHRAPVHYARPPPGYRTFVKGDVPVVEKLYRDYFEGVASTATMLNFSALEWGDVEVAMLALVLPHYASLASLDLSWNRVGSDGAQRLSEALKTNSALQTLKCAATRPIPAVSSL